MTAVLDRSTLLLTLLAALDHLTAFLFAIGFSVQIIALPLSVTTEDPFPFLVFSIPMTLHKHRHGNKQRCDNDQHENIFHRYLPHCELIILNGVCLDPGRTAHRKLLWAGISTGLTIKD